MGTRADFYVGRGKSAKWVGSIAFDGYPDGITPYSEKTENWLGYTQHLSDEWPTNEHLFDSITEEQFLSRLKRFFQYRDDVTLPEEGWPWPWDDSNTTDYSYAFDEGKVWGTCFGRGWWQANKELKEHNNNIGDYILV